MLRDGEGWHFNLREVARRAGVSHAAPYKHFPDKAALLAELAVHGYHQLQEDLIAALTLERQSSRSEAIAAARAYLDFGRWNPLLYELMFSSEIDNGGQAAIHKASFATFAVIVDILTRGQQAGEFKAAPVEGQAATLWGLLHGLTVLERGRHLPPTQDGSMLIDAAIASLLEGLDA